MTIRRDLDTLSRKVPLKVVQGLIFVNDNATISNYNYFGQLGINERKKDKIAKHSMKYINPKDIVIFDIGTSIDYVIDNLPNKCTISAITSSIYSVNKLINKEISDIYFLGGKFQKDTGMLESFHSVEYLKTMRADIYFMSAAGVSDKLDLMCENEYEVLTKKTSLKSANKTILIIDSTKYGKNKPSYIVNMSDVDLVITDSGIDEKYIKLMEENNINYEIVNL